MEFKSTNYKENCIVLTNQLCNLCDSIAGMTDVITAVERFTPPNQQNNGTLSTLKTLILADYINCTKYIHIHNRNDSFPVTEFLFFRLYLSDKYHSFDDFLENSLLKINSNLILLQIKCSKLVFSSKKGHYRIVDLLCENNHIQEAIEYATIMLNFAKNELSIANEEALSCDGYIRFLESELSLIGGENSNINSSIRCSDTFPNNTAIINQQAKESASPILQINQLIGLNRVKNDVNDLANLVKMQQIRKQRGIIVNPFSYHCVFIGNPGTGKTTVARLLAQVYKDLGVLKKGHLVETDRSGLVAEYVGHTAIKTNAIIDKALDGVLFIDEAYALAQGGSNDFGKEAISTLLKRMEDDRNRLIVILAGYQKEMQDFIKSNSGLQSRFNRFILFEDYNADELYLIFKSFLTKSQYTITEKAAQLVKGYIESAYEHKNTSFGNARYIRNIFERIITCQSNRLAVLDAVTDQMLMEIIEDDIHELTKYNKL